MQSNCLQLSINKMEHLLLLCARRQHQLLQSECRIGTDVIILPTWEYVDADLSTSHVQQTVTRCFSVLRQLRSV